VQPSLPQADFPHQADDVGVATDLGQSPAADQFGFIGIPCTQGSGCEIVYGFYRVGGHFKIGKIVCDWPYLAFRIIPL
jgi:hypothetical protein